MASSLPPPEDVRAFRAAARSALASVRGLDPALACREVTQALRSIDVALADFDRAADLAALAPAKPDAPDAFRERAEAAEAAHAEAVAVLSACIAGYGDDGHRRAIESRRRDCIALAPPKPDPRLTLADDLAHVVASELTGIDAGMVLDRSRLLAALDAYRSARKGEPSSLAAEAHAEQPGFERTPGREGAR